MPRFLSACYGMFLCLCMLSLPAQSEEGEANSKLILQLGADTAEERDAAEKDIAKKGMEILPLLEEAAQSDDPEISIRAKNLIPKIRARVPLEQATPLSEFLEAYAKSGEQGNSALVRKFISREKLNMEEARALLWLLYQEQNKDAYLSISCTLKLTQLLSLESEKLLNQGKIREATELWKEFPPCPQYRHRYAAMLYNSGLPLNPEGLSEEYVRLVKTELALLNRDIGKARELAPPNDLYINQRLAAVDFDLEGRWKPVLENANIDSCNHQTLLLLYHLARMKEDQTSLDQITARLKKDAEQYESDDNKFFSYTPNNITAINLLYSTQSPEEAFSAFSRMISSATNNDQWPYLTAYARSPYFDLRLLGAESNSLEGAIKLAQSLTNQVSFDKNETEPDKSRQNTLERYILFQKLITLFHYMDSRGEKDKMIPHLFSFIEQTCQTQLFYIALYSFLMADRRDMAFDIYQGTLECRQINKEWLPLIEKMLLNPNTFLSVEETKTEEEIQSLFTFIDSTTTPETPRKEKIRLLLILSGMIKGNEGESKQQHQKALAYLREMKDPGGADIFASALINRYLRYQKSPDELDELLLAMKRPFTLDPYSFFAPQVFFSHIREFASEQVKHDYIRHLQDILKSNPEERAEESGSAQISFPRETAGEHLSLLLYKEGKKKDALSLLKSSRLYAPSESLSRVRYSLYLIETSQSEEYLQEAFPEYVVDIDETSYANNFFSSYYSLSIGNHLLFSGEYKRASYCFISSMSMLHPYWDKTEPNLWTLIQSEAELSRCLSLWETGDKDASLQSLEKAVELIKSHDIYSFLPILVLHSPELKLRATPCFERIRQEQLELLKKWPRHKTLTISLVERALLLDNHREETHDLIKSQGNATLREELLDLEQVLDAWRKGDLKTLSPILMKRIRSGHNESYLWASLYGELRYPSKKSILSIIPKNDQELSSVLAQSSNSR